MEEGCDKIYYTDVGGKELKINKYMVSFTPQGDENTYIEQVDGNRLNGSMKERLKKARPGDKIMILQLMQPINFSSEETPSGNSNAARMYYIVE